MEEEREDTHVHTKIPMLQRHKEDRIILYSGTYKELGHHPWSQLHRDMYNSTPEMRIPPLIRTHTHTDLHSHRKTTYTFKQRGSRQVTRAKLKSGAVVKH